MNPRSAVAAVVAAGLLATATVLSAPAALAQQDRERGWETEDIPRRLEETLRELMDRMRPALEDAFALLGVLEEIDSPANYDKPVILPNGDILIPRSSDAPEWRPDRGEPEDAPEFEPHGPDRRQPNREMVPT